MSSTTGQPEFASDSLMGARTVALIVHGIGDHTQMDILDELGRGLERTLPADSFEADRLRIAGIPLPSGQLGSVDVTRIRTAAGDRFIIPFIWSHDHLRAETQIQDELFIQTNSVQHFQMLIAKTARPLFELCGNSFRCIPKSASVGWRLALTAFALLTAGLIICLTLGLGYCITFLPYILAPETHSSTWWFYLVAIAIIPALIRFIFRKSVHGLDLVGDIVFYVGQPERRRNVEARMLKIIDWVRDNASHADIIVVGHSLGSVLVSHCLKNTSAMPAPRKLLLTTLGSPLSIMSHVFPGHILTPDQLLDIYSTSRSVSFWMNLWRDSDWIGRSLHMASTDNFAEISVGNGLHPNYWADSRIWAKLIALMEAQESGKIDELTHEWSKKELTDSEKQEALQLYRIFRVHSVIALVALATLAFIGRDIFSSDFATSTNATWVLAVKALYFANFLVLFPLGFTYFVTRLGGTPRQIFGRLRFAYSLFAIFIKLWFLVGIAFMVLRLIAPRL